MKLVKTLLIASSLLVATGLYQFVNKPDANAAVSTCPALLQHQVKDIHGKVQNLCQYQGKVVLVVNTASFCGYTPQYKDLQTLYDRYQKKGLVILGFPANNFGKQEPGSNQEIAKFCKENYKVSFPMFGKTQVTGAQASSLFKQLTQKTGQAPLWNFHKYLVDRQGKQVASFDSGTTPLNGKLTKQLEQMLAAK